VEYLGECSHHKGLTGSSITVIISFRHGNRKFMEAIVKPVIMQVRRLTTELVESLIDDLRGHGDQLPVLQHAMMRTWTTLEKLNE